MSQKKVAEKLGISQTGYGKAERGEVNPSKYIEKLSENFNVEKTDIEQGKDGQVINNYGHIEIVANNNYNLENLSLIEVKEVLSKVVASIERLESQK